MPTITSNPQIDVSLAVHPVWLVFLTVEIKTLAKTVTAILKLIIPLTKDIISLS